MGGVCAYCGAYLSDLTDKSTECDCSVQPRFGRSLYIVPELVEDPGLLKAVYGAMYLSPKDKRLYHSCAVCGKIYDITGEASYRRRIGADVTIACSVCHKKKCHSHVLAMRSWCSEGFGSVVSSAFYDKVLGELPKEESFRTVDIDELRGKLKRLSEAQEEDE